MKERENNNERVVEVDFMTKNGVPAMAGRRIHGPALGALVRNDRKEDRASVRAQSPGGDGEDVSDVAIRDRRDHRARSGLGKRTWQR